MDELRRSLRPRALRAAMARLGAVVVALALVLAVVRGGTRYFYCPIMQVAMSSSCCASARAGEGADDLEVSAALVASDCCEARRLATLPLSPLPAVPDAPVPPLAALVPAAAFIDSAMASRPVARFAHPVRAGPKSARDRRADLMIWTC